MLPSQTGAPLIQQFTNQARPLLRAELIFARHVCHLNREELRKLNDDAQKMLDEVVTKLVDAQFQPRRVQMGGGQMAGMTGGQVRIPKRPTDGLDARELLAEGVVAVMKQDLSAEQWSIYQAERQKRDENRKRMTIRYFVDAIDRELYLSKGHASGSRNCSSTSGSPPGALPGKPPLWEPVLSDDD